MNRNVASSALATGLKSKPSVRRLGQLVESGMTLQAELAAFATDQQHAISRTVWTVTADTAFHLHSGVLVHKWSALLAVALDAGFGLRLHKTRTIQCSVRSVTIGAFHQSLRDAVMHRLCKLCADRRVTGVAQFRL